MSRIKSKNTSPEAIIRTLLWKSGKRYRIHDTTIEGTPDISNKSKKIAIFIDGCFWHGCKKCYVKPKSNVVYWEEKLLRNKARRKNVIQLLGKNDWRIVQMWEHDVRNDPTLEVEKIKKIWND